MGKYLIDAVSTAGILLKFYTLFTSPITNLFWHILIFEMGSKEGTQWHTVQEKQGHKE